MVAAKKADFYAIAEKFHVDPVVARIIRNREVIWVGTFRTCQIRIR